MKYGLELFAVGCIVMAIAGCSDDGAKPPAASPAAKPDLGQPGSATDMFPDTLKPSSGEAKPERGAKAPADASPKTAVEGQGAKTGETGEKSKLVDDTINDIDEEDQK